jgi:polar amino acid transport system permease protein
MTPDLYFTMRLIPALFQGAGVTLELSLATFGVCLAWGLVVALARRRLGPIAWAAEAYVQIARNTPLLIQLYIVYYGFGLLGFGMSAFDSGLFVLCLQHGAYFAEIYRGGLQSVSRRQFEAARTLGMPPVTAYLTVILPQAARRVIPPLTNQAASIVKDTSQVAVISVMEMNKVSQIWLESSANTYDVFVSVAVIYLAMTSTIGALGKIAERRWAYVQ